MQRELFWLKTSGLSYFQSSSFLLLIKREKCLEFVFLDTLSIIKISVLRCFSNHIYSWVLLFIAFFLVETTFTSSSSGDQTVNEGSSLTLFCNATGKPTPNVTWTRVLENGTDGDVVFFGNPWFLVNISRTATGTYRCTAYNGIGSPVNHWLNVNVTCKYKHAPHIGEINIYYVLM